LLTQKEIRTQGRRARNAMSDDERAFASEKIFESVTHASWFQRSKYIACYLPVPGEVDTWRIIARAWRMKKRIFAPIIKKNGLMQFREITAETALRRTDQGIYEPGEGPLIAARSLDIVITPLVAFDKFNHRIGMGGGYFDRTFCFLSNRQAYARPKLVGVAFACQKVEEIAPNPWDIPLFTVITETS
jgi:5-formyltetrahydrofolate cyclo-ligase